MAVIPFQQRSSKKGNTHSSLVQKKPPRGVPALGIDLGTTNSVASLYVPGHEHPRSLEFEGAPLVPSMLYVDDQANTPSSSEAASNAPTSPVVGRRARERLAMDASDVVRSTKRDMGRPGRLFSSGERSFSAEEAACEVLKYLSQHPELEEVREKYGGLWTVVTVPAHFDDAARQATIASAAQAGLEVLRIINEPTAAALAYSMLPDVRHHDSELLAVFDLGGGTFDVSIVERDGLVFNVLSSEGDVELGGDDFDLALARHLLENVEPVLSARRATEDSDLFRNLLVLAESAKKALQEEGEFRVTSADLDGRGARIDTVLTRDVFESLIAPLVRRTLELTERAVLAARKRPPQISRILLVGGSTRVTAVHRMLQAHFPACLVDARLEPDLAVSWGAAVQAAIILGIEPDTILVDVCSHTLGIGVAEDSRAVGENFKETCKKFGILQPVDDAKLAALLGPRLADFNAQLQGLLRVAPIIHRNSPLPSRKSEFFSTLYHNQAAVQVVVVQGDEGKVSENRLIGSFLFELQQPCPAGTRCEIQLTYDVNGMVHVLAKQLGTENIAEAEFDSRTGEVKGWLSLDDTDTDTDTVVDAEIETEAVAHLSLAPVLSAPFGGGSSRQSSRTEEVHGSESSDTDILNGLLLRLRRHLAKVLPGQPSSPDATQANLPAAVAMLVELERRYTALLRNAARGDENDALLEETESAILDGLESARP
ncbi:MAG: Hsp70 family protein [Silvanigrellales bacterium]|nr:Hsp70 family protein [Silvanigrellales bacterium]